MVNRRLRIAIQKKGRLFEDSIKLFKACGLKVRIGRQSLFYHCENFPIDILLVRDDDIPTLIIDEICDWGIVGENVLQEQALCRANNGNSTCFTVVQSLGFGRCRLAIAVPADAAYQSIKDLANRRIATSYPYLLKAYLAKANMSADILQLSGSVEVAPRLGMADAICDLVSTGKTLEENNLVERDEVYQSQAVLIQAKRDFTADEQSLLALLLQRIQGVLLAEESKYIWLHAPKTSLPAINRLLPGEEAPTIVPLAGEENKVAVHVVSKEGVFWVTLEKLKAAGASSILVLPIEKMLG